MDCPNIDNIKLSGVSKDTVETIRSIREVANVLTVSLSVGAVVSIFAGNNFVESSISVSTYDFEEFAKQMKGIPDIARRRVEQEAMMASLNVSDYKEKQFWRAVADGCSVH